MSASARMVDMEAAALKYRELDGKVDAFGVGGADLGLTVGTKGYPLYSIKSMVRYVKQTPSWMAQD